MSEKKYDINQYSAGDIQRYHDGQMSPAEMHALERAALDDPFLADAIEGYELLDADSNRGNIKELNTRLAKRTAVLNGAAWWRVAAAILIVVTGAFLTYFLFIKDDELQLAKIEKNSAPDTESTQAPRSSTVSGSDSLAAEALQLPVRPDSLAAQASQLPVYTRPDSMAAPSDEQDVRNAYTPIQSLSKNRPRKRRSSSEPGKEREQQFVAANKSTHIDSIVPEAVTTDQLLRSKTSEEKAVALKKKEEFIVRDTAAFQKDAVASHNDNKRNATVAANLAAEVLTAAPVVDWRTYYEYLDRDKKVPVEDSGRHGTVVVNFTVKRSGKLTDFKIEKSLSPSLDKEAIRLVKEGPGWKVLKGRQAKATLVVNF